MSQVWVAVALVAVALLAQTLFGRLRPLPRVTADGDEAARVSVVVPARDEAATLPRLLGSLSELRAPVCEVVVVDDQSRDTTASVAHERGATVLRAEDPPPGWTGKAWACHLGATGSTGELLLFLDADTVLAPDALDRLLALHRCHRGLLSVQPFHDVVRPYEHLSAYFNVVSLLATTAVGPRHEQRGAAFGPCLLTSRSDYERAGGHASVRGEILDDVALARAYHRAGLPVRCAIGGRSVRMRMYPGGVAQLAEGWTKNVASGAAAAAPLPTLLTVLWVAAHHAVAVGAGLALLRAVTGDSPPPAAHSPLLWLAAWGGVAAQLRWLLARIGSFRWWSSVFFPVPLLAFDILFARSAVRTVVRRSVRWRGRDVRLAKAPATAEER